MFKNNIGNIARLALAFLVITIVAAAYGNASRLGVSESVAFIIVLLTIALIVYFFRVTYRNKSCGEGWSIEVVAKVNLLGMSKIVVAGQSGGEPVNVSSKANLFRENSHKVRISAKETVIVKFRNDAPGLWVKFKNT